MLGQSRTSPIGVDLADDRVQLTQLRRVSGGGLTLQAFGGWNWSMVPHGAVDLEDLRKQAELIAEAIKKGRFVGRRVVVRVPDKLLMMKNVRVPPIPDEDLFEAAQWEAAERFQIDPEQSVIRYYDVGEVTQGSETKREIILMAAPTEPLLELARSLDGAGLDVASFDPTPTLLTRFQHVIEKHGVSDGEDMSAPRLIIQVSPEHTWVFISENGQVVFLRRMEFGAKDFEEAVAPAIKSNQDDGTYGLRVSIDRVEAEKVGVKKRVDLAQEVALCLRYYGVTFPGKRPEMAWLIAPETIARCVAPSLAERASVRVMLPHEFDVRLPQLFDAIGQPLASMASSIGLAMNWPGGRLAA
ncbi:MAG: pilus assembly protein PilM [Phycisphaeraceae bacterium]